MNRVHSAPPRSSPVPPRRGGLLVALGAIAGLLAFAGGAWLADRPPAPTPSGRSPARAAADPGWRPPAQSAPSPDPAPAALAAAPAPAPQAPPLAAPRAAPSRELVALVTEEARRSLEDARPAFLERCLPPSRRAGATFTFNVTFDASGREIARGISEDRRFRAPEVASCLRKLPIGALRVNPPGARVGVRLSMNVP